jgi:AraC-like DNA-binding protein
MAASSSMPAGTAQAMLAGFGAVGLDAARLAQRCGLKGLSSAAFDAPVPRGAFVALWKEALTLQPDPTLPTRVGLAVPFGAFSTVDYLAGSSPRVDTAFGCLATWFGQVTHEFRVEVSSSAAGGLVELLPQEPFPGRAISDEFTVAVMVGRFRDGTQAGVTPSAVRLVREAPPRGAEHARLLGAPVHFGVSVSALEWSPAAWRTPIRTADPALQRTLESLARQLSLGPAAGALESALRARLRDLLPAGPVSATRAAGALGLSGRTLQRHLQAEGTSYREVIDRFREAEAERLVTAGQLPLAEVALRLGFSDQTAWNRAFRRWKQQSPRAWARAAAGPPPRRARGRS